jgi:uncharacterized heparinase superfamily protein
MTRPHGAHEPPAVLRLVETLRHLRWRQVAWRGWYVAAGPFVRQMAARPQPRAARRPWPGGLQSRSFLTPRQTSPGSFTAVGETGRIAAAADWNSPDRSKLWLFNVHYLDDLANHGIPEADRAALLAGWIAANPPACGVGWHPYPTSLRLVNAITFASRRDHVPAPWLESIARQAHALDWQVEHQIGANHVFANAKALVFAGAFLDGPGADRRLARGLRLVDAEIAEQFLPDGGHYERSPMYHALALWDLCDLLELARASGLPNLEARTGRWRDLLSRGIGWLAAMTHPDGRIAFFNDAAFGIAPTLDQIHDYAASVGCPSTAVPPPSYPHVQHLAPSGYVVVALADDAKAILDVAPIGPAHQPGHTHADTLSCELSVHGHRLVVNGGTSTYAVGPDRQRQRSTAAHSTVEIAGTNSSDVWKSFRVGRRARPFDIRVEQDALSVTVAASHDGYTWLPGGPVHTRRWRCEPGKVTVSDEVSGGQATAVARFHLHPEVAADGHALRLPGGQQVTWHASGDAARVVADAWHPEFGASVPSTCLEFVVPPGGSALELAW